MRFDSELNVSGFNPQMEMENVTALRNRENPDGDEKDRSALYWMFGVAAALLLALAALPFRFEAHVAQLPQRTVVRDLASLTFPTVSDLSESDDILHQYPVYLNFVLEVGRETDAQGARRLADLYQRLVRTNPPGAARFLKGLRFEMVEKLELTGMSPAQANTRNPNIRRWVSKFMREWVRECDENLFRSIALRASRRTQKDKN